MRKNHLPSVVVYSETTRELVVRAEFEREENERLNLKHAKIEREFSFFSLCITRMNEQGENFEYLISMHGSSFNKKNGIRFFLFQLHALSRFFLMI